MTVVRITAELELDDDYTDEEDEVDTAQVSSDCESQLSSVGIVLGEVDVTYA